MLACMDASHLHVKCGHMHRDVYTYASIHTHTRHGHPRVCPHLSGHIHPLSLLCLPKKEGAGSGVRELARHSGVDPALVEVAGGEERCFSWFPLSCILSTSHLCWAAASLGISLDLLKKTHQGTKTFPQ